MNCNDLKTNHRKEACKFLKDNDIHDMSSYKGAGDYCESGLSADGSIHITFKIKFNGDPSEYPEQIKIFEKSFQNPLLTEYRLVSKRVNRRVKIKFYYVNGSDNSGNIAIRMGELNSSKRSFCGQIIKHLIDNVCVGLNILTGPVNGIICGKVKNKFRGDYAHGNTIYYYDDPSDKCDHIRLTKQRDCCKNYYDLHNQQTTIHELLHSVVWDTHGFWDSIKHQGTSNLLQEVTSDKCHENIFQYSKMGSCFDRSCCSEGCTIKDNKIPIKLVAKMVMLCRNM